MARKFVGERRVNAEFRYFGGEVEDFYVSLWIARLSPAGITLISGARSRHRKRPVLMNPKVFILGDHVRDGSILLDGRNSLVRLKAELAIRKLLTTQPGCFAYTALNDCKKDLMRVRHYGRFANRCRRARLGQIKEALRVWCTTQIEGLTGTHTDAPSPVANASDRA